MSSYSFKENKVLYLYTLFTISILLLFHYCFASASFTEIFLFETIFNSIVFLIILPFAFLFWKFVNKNTKVILLSLVVTLTLVTVRVSFFTYQFQLMKPVLEYVYKTIENTAQMQPPSPPTEKDYGEYKEFTHFFYKTSSITYAADISLMKHIESFDFAGIILEEDRLADPKEREKLSEDILASIKWFDEYMALLKERMHFIEDTFQKDTLNLPWYYEASFYSEFLPLFKERGDLENEIMGLELELATAIAELLDFLEKKEGGYKLAQDKKIYFISRDNHITYLEKRLRVVTLLEKRREAVLNLATFSEKILTETLSVKPRSLKN